MLTVFICSLVVASLNISVTRSIHVIFVGFINIADLVNNCLFIFQLSPFALRYWLSSNCERLYERSITPCTCLRTGIFFIFP